MTTEPAPQPKPPARSVFNRLTGPRMNRKIFWIWAGGLIAVAVATSFIPTGAGDTAGRGIGAATGYFWIVLFNARLHDLGRSGWWQALLYLVQLVLLFALVFAAQVSIDIAAGVAVLLQLAFTVALGAIPGQRGPNRFGPSPSEPPPEAVSETFR